MFREMVENVLTKNCNCKHFRFEGDNNGKMVLSPISVYVYVSMYVYMFVCVSMKCVGTVAIVIGHHISTISRCLIYYSKQKKRERGGEKITKQKQKKKKE